MLRTLAAVANKLQMVPWRELVKSVLHMCVCVSVTVCVRLSSLLTWMHWVCAGLMCSRVWWSTCQRLSVMYRWGQDYSTAAFPRFFGACADSKLSITQHTKSGSSSVVVSFAHG